MVMMIHVRGDVKAQDPVMVGEHGAIGTIGMTTFGTLWIVGFDLTWLEMHTL